MKVLYRVWILIALSTLVFSVGFAFITHQAAASTPPPPMADSAIREAVQKAIALNKQSVLGFMVNNVEVVRIQYSLDNRTALVWLAQRDLETGDILGREPGYAVARSTTGVLAQPDSWQVNFSPADLASLPPELISEEMRQSLISNPTAFSTAAATFTGYKLPWSSALRIKITGSVGHFLDYHSCSELSCRYAYDFWNPDSSNRMFPILASKGGFLRAWRESCANNDHSCPNYLVLEDNSTSPTTYQLYYHIAYHSLAAGLKAGDYVQQGQYIANVDNTGASTDSHLHFMVYQSPTGSNYSWGNSVRILFSDVTFNGGEPRTCYEALAFTGYGTQCSAGADGKKGTSDDDYLTSGNVGTQSPTGSLDAPAAWTTLSTKTLTLSGKASDNLGVSRVEILANSGAGWKSIGSANIASGSYTQSLDVCAAGIPDGPFGLAVRIWNIAGNWAGPYTGVRQLINNAGCGGTAPVFVPACLPAADEVALYSEPNFGGVCKKYPAGKYNTAALAPLGDNSAASIQVGANVHAVLFDLNDDLNLVVPLGRLETFTVQDLNLADNRIGTQKASALWVMNAADMANPSTLEPFLTFPGSQVDSDRNSALQPNPANPVSSDSLVLAWTGGRGATLFSAKLEKDGALVKEMVPQYTQSWDVGSLPAGTYTWTVTACIGTSTCAGMVSNSTALTFTVDPAALSSSGQVDAPTPTLDLETSPAGWSTTGLWHWGSINRLQTDLSTTPTNAWLYNNGTSFNSPTDRGGDLTSPPLRVSAAGTYYLHFRFFSGVEGPRYDGQTFAGQYWDQRSVQVSLDGGPFASLSQSPSVAPLVEDAQNTSSFWPDSAPVKLGTFTSGQILRVRFHFDSIDPYYNDLLGWAVDDIRVDTSGPDGSCSGDLSNETPATASTLTLDGPAFDSRICPQGDWDFYKFSGIAGKAVRIQIDAKSSDPLNPLDSFITLLDSSGRSVIAANDDADPTNAQPQYRDSLIETVLPYTGVYHVRVRAWDYPGSGGLAYAYKLSLATASAISPNASHPTVAITKPLDPKHLPTVPFIFQADAADPDGGGVKKVDFYWHSSDWVNTSWVLFASDSTAGDGWWGIFNPPADATGGAFYVMATNTSGGTGGALLTGVVTDASGPPSQMNALPAQTDDTAVLLSWSAADPNVQIDYFNIQYTFNGGGWVNWPTQPDGWQRSAWFVGAPGSYQFRMVAVTLSGSQGTYPVAAEAATHLNGSCSNDTYETNNTRASATAAISTEVLRMVLCQNDADWVSFQGVPGQEYGLMFPSLGGGAAVHVRLYDPSGTIILAEGQSMVGQGLVLRWTAPAAGTYTLEITASDPALYGSGVQYGVYAGPANSIFAPLINP